MTKPELAKEMFLRARDRITYEELVARSKQRRLTPCGEIDGNGVNVDLIRELLAMSVQERLRAAEDRLRAAEAARNMVHTVH